ncbi:uncharacterized protein LOC131428164 [Malaya genurostris]|uniref:uncharacterized protein LOC131428164 n=1 Tax=Malaya genurostris TaxID=325434 RepID=UPI0026F3E7FF|nr:uncharacterized protein LOC131428164 [Malaya genurostris]
MYSQLRDNIWDRIRLKNKEANHAHNRGRNSAVGDSVGEWDLSQIELHDERQSVQNIPTIDLGDDDEPDATSFSRERSSVQCASSSVHTPQIHSIPISKECTSPSSSAAVNEDRPMVRRPIHDYRAIFGGIPLAFQQQEVNPVPAGIIFNRVYNKKVTPSKENYFSVMDTPPSPGELSAARIFGGRPVVSEPKIVMTSNHYEKRFIRRSFDKSAAATPTRINRREKNNGPYKLLGIIDLEPETDSEESVVSHTPSGKNNSTRVSVASHRSNTTRNTALLGSPTLTPNLGSSNEEAKMNKLYTIEIEEDEREENEDTTMELSEAEDESQLMKEDEADKSLPGTSKTNCTDDFPEEHCTLTDSETSSATQVNPSSLANSFWDVSSSGCMKITSDKDDSVQNCKKHTEFDLLLDRINKQVPAMSQQDRIEHWRVTKEDLLYSIPTVAEIESSTSVKRHMDDPIHISSGESSSGSETSDSPSLLKLKQNQKSNFKKRRTIDSSLTGEASSPSLHLSETLDFRRTQINPEIDKASSQIQVRRNYCKFPTRFNRLAEEDSVPGNGPSDPYANFLNNDTEKETFTQYLCRNPAYRPDLLTKLRCRPEVDDNKVAVVLLSPISLSQPTTVESNVNSIRAPPDRPKSADRVSRYDKNRSTSVGKTLRYKVRKPQLKKKSIVVVRSNLRSIRRLMMKSSLRNGKVRKKSSFVNLLNSSKQKRRKGVSIQSKSESNLQELEKHQNDTNLSVPEETQQKDVPVRNQLSQSTRVSVDSAVSSSTSAEHKQQETPALEPPPLKAPTDIRTMKNPLSRTNGEVLMVFFEANKLIVIQQELVSFWECSKLTALLGLKQELHLIGQIKRSQTDFQIDSLNSQRLGFNENAPFYMEPRARNLDEDESRVCPLASVYINHYFMSTSEDDKEEHCVRMKSLQLDSVRSKLPDLLFVTLPRSRYFIICWHEQMSETDFRTGLCKYSLTPDLETLASIREFPTITQKINSLKCMDNEQLIGLGSSMVVIWSYENGYLLFTVDLKVCIHQPLVTFVHSENDEKALFLVQLCPSSSGNPKRKLIKVIAINMSKRSWHQVLGYEVPLESTSILCESTLSADSTGLHCTTFQNGELLAISLDDLTTCFTNHKQLQSPEERRVTRDILATREKIFIGSTDGRQIVLVSDKFIKLKTIDEYSLVSS